ncbi:putative ABC transport system substrate-binding protein [Variovorax boronicumulans]|uniref:ABC transporter substrate binding protein n=1 Tax=Variovorax boronicumulans TaxID=436515 RepID=UPI0024757F05|nr:ABC transporter substrate binding protein [Variovorax boronicumulans]MDH6170186.1 putative ABC transport system substrate-binding protein [Variovorax boronicumulans]
MSVVAKHLSLPFPGRLHRAARAVLAFGLTVGVAIGLLGLSTSSRAAAAASLTVLMSDDNAAHSEFVQQLRASQEPGGRFELVRLSPTGEMPQAVEMAGAETERGANAGVRTRSMRPSAADANLTMAVGIAAARAAVERPGQEPLVLAMLSRLDYEALKAASPALKRGDRRVGVLLRDPAMADQLALIGAVLPQKHRIGVVATPESEPLVRELQRAAQGANPAWDVRVEYAPDAKSLAAALRTVVPLSDALMVLPDLIGDNQAATLSVLRAGAGAGLPVFGASEGLVRSGGLAAAVSTPSQLAQQARLLGQKVASAGSSNSPLVEAATPATVRVNATVARGLGLRLPEERELTDRLAATR